MEGDLNYGPGETQKLVPVRLLELGEKDSLLEDKQIKQFVMHLSNPRVGAELGRYPKTTITIADQPGKKPHTALHILFVFLSNICFILSHPEPSVMMFKKSTQNFSTSDPTFSIPVVRSRNQDSSTTVKWRTKKAQRFDLSGPLKFNPGETEKNIVIDTKTLTDPIRPETFQLELFDPSNNASIGERKTTIVNILDAGETS